MATGSSLKLAESDPRPDSENLWTVVRALETLERIVESVLLYLRSTEEPEFLLEHSLPVPLRRLDF